MAIRTLVVGVGRRGVDWVRAVAASEAFELVGCVDVDPAAAVRLAQSGVDARGAWFGRLEEACAASRPDAVIVATPAEDHAPACRAALERGLAVLVEKPFTLSMADAAALVHLAARAGRPLLVAQNYRYLRVFRAMRDTIAAGRLGRVTHVHWHYYRIPHDMAPSLARLRHSVLWGMGIHHLDALRVVLGDRVVSVSADLFTGHESSGLDGASFHVLLTLASGARAVYTATYESSGHEFFERGQEFHGRVVGERATLHAVHRWLWIAEGRRLPRPIPRGRRTITEEQMLLETFARAVRDGAGVEGEASGRDNLQTMAVAEACVRSAAERRTIDLEEVQP